MDITVMYFLATDGGLYSSSNNGLNWIDIENIPNNQFYRVAVNPFQPNDFYGGLQDNGSVGGNASGFNTWARYFGGDGFQMLFSPTNSQHWYCETQNGALWVSSDAGTNFNWHGNGIDGNDRVSWDMPFILSHSNADVQYCGTYRVYKNTGGVNANWQVISPDITDGIDNRYHVISTVNESPLDPNVLYAGTTDGNVWITTNGGTNWTDITDTLPDRYITSVKGSASSPSRLFVSHSGYKDNDNSPHLHRSDNYGATWQNIAGDLPPLAINDIFIYPPNDSVIFVANDGGVYATLDAGSTWQRIGNNMPIVAVYDLEIEPVNNLLVAGTYGRSLWTFPIDSVFVPLDTVPVPEILVNGNTSFCEGDSALLTVSNGPYDGYIWSNGDTTASIVVKISGTYSVIGIQNGCPSDSSISQIITVNALPAKPVISASGPIQFCDGGDVTLNGPAGFSSYLWSNGDTNPAITITQSTSLTLTVTDANLCQSPPSDTIEVTVSPLPAAPMISGPSTICDGASILLSGPSGYGGYFWSNNALVKDIIVFLPGTFTLIVIDSNNCMSPPSASFIVSSGTAPTAMFSSDINGTQVSFFNGSLNVGISGAYHWDFGDSSAVDSNENPIHVFPGSGSYTVTLIVSNDCGSDTVSSEISVISASIDPALSWTASIQIYPNPASDHIYIKIPQLSAPHFEYQLTDLRGKIIFNGSKLNQVGEFTTQISIGHLAEGMYLLNLSDGEKRFTRRIWKKN
ncbi:MAG: PKD domain-containing protein [Bacteroidia bacterium]